MKNISVRAPFMKFWYVLTWISFILFGVVIFWVIALFLYNYKDNDVDKKEGVLNLSSQKLIWWYGTIVIILLVIGLIIGLFI